MSLRFRVWRTLSRLNGLLARRPGEAALDEELRFHLEALTEEFVRSGLDRGEAVRQARLRLDVERTKEAWREERSVPPAEAALLDLRHAARGLRRDKGFTVAALLTLALGIGAAAVVFSLVSGVLLRPLPYPGADRLVRVFETSARFPRFPLSPLNFGDYEKRTRAFAGFGAWTRQDLELSGEGRPQRLRALRVSPGYFEVLGARPALGRTFREDETRGDPRVVVLSHALWVDRFGSDPATVGRVVRLDGHPFTVVGVMPKGFEHVGGDYRSLPHGETVDAWWPVSLDPEKVQRSWHYLNAVARLRPGTTLAQAQGDADRVGADLAKEYPEAAGWQPRLLPLRDELLGSGTPALLLLSGAVGLLLLIACANVASLLLARATARRRERAVRHALGASRARLTALALAESFVLAAAGSALGLALAKALLPALLAAMPADFPRLHAVRLDSGVLLFSLGLLAAVTLAFGLLPALRGGGDLRGALHEGGGSTAGARTLRWRGGLVVAQVTLACALLVVASLLGRSFESLLRVEPGFSPRGAVAFEVALPASRYPSPKEAAAFFARLEERLLALPGVQAAGFSTALPWTGWDENTGFGIVGDREAREDEPNARFGSASPGLFAALGLPVRQGRTFGPADASDTPPVVAVNEALARKYFPGEDPVGHRLNLWGATREIVGVFGDVKDGPTDLEAKPAFFWPMAQQPFPAASVVVRSDSPEAVLGAVRGAVASLDPELPVANLRPLEEVANEAHARRRFLLFLVTAFAGLALLLSGVGAYGVLAYAVECRRREIGIRLALGAGGLRVVRLVAGQSLGLAALGVALGVSLALALGRLLQSLLYGVSPRDPVSLAASASTLLVVCALAAVVPAWRAARSAPARVLRAE